MYIFASTVDRPAILFIPDLDDLYLPHYILPNAVVYASRHLWNQPLLHSINLIRFTPLLVHLILHISPHHSHHPSLFKCVRVKMQLVVWELVLSLTE